MNLSKFFFVLFLIISCPVATAEFTNTNLTLAGFDPNKDVPPGQDDPRKAFAVIRNAPELLRTEKNPESGNPNGKVTLVEFFDYQCSHCIAANPTVVAVMKINPELRVVYKEFPLNSGVSTYAAKAALAANMQGKYFQFHDALMRAAGGLTEAKVLDIAKTCGLNIDKLKVDMESSEVADALKANYKLAQSLGISGTPVLIGAPSDLQKTSNVTGIFYILGAPDYMYLQNLISKIKT
ncbi:MAG: DsbA family protein [Pseudomonadota bacterium]